MFLGPYNEVEVLLRNVPAASCHRISKLLTKTKNAIAHTYLRTVRNMNISLLMIKL